MNNYSAETRKRGRSLLVVEGKHEKDELCNLCGICFNRLFYTISVKRIKYSTILTL